MTDQSKPEKDGTPDGYQPPSYIPAHESDVPAPPTPTTPLPSWPATSKLEQQGYGQQRHGAQGQPGEQYGWPGYNQPTEPHSASSGAGAQQPYSQPYGAPAQYGQPGSPFNAYGPPGYYGAPPEPKGLSIASLCCGIAAFVGLGFFLLPQLAAVILGHLALKREPSGRGMAIAGLVLGYVAILLTVLAIVIIAVGVAVTSSGRMYYGA